jgi:ATP-dependent Clp protease ATP-binding subunit ClpX
VALREGTYAARCEACGVLVNRRERRREGVRPVDLARTNPELRRFVEGLPDLTPRQMYQRLEELGYRGQERPRRAVCLAAYRHVRRLKRLFLEGAERAQVPPKTNLLLMGPTGCGKTYLVELLFREILQVPTVIIDVTNYSETGYIGEDTRTILTRLVHAAGGSVPIASCGIVALDEFDKLASGHNTARFAGEGTTKDVSGFGVQRELLAMLESSEVQVPMDFGHSAFGPRVVLDTSDVAFLAIGAFSGYTELHHRRRQGDSLGLRSNPRSRYREGVAYLLDEEDAQDIESFQAYGFLPELIGRFARLVAFEPLDRETLREILVANVLSRYQNEFRAEGLTLQVDEEVLEAVVAESLRRQTGARGLAAVLTRALEDVAFEAFPAEAGAVRVWMEEGRIRSRLE